MSITIYEIVNVVNGKRYVGSSTSTRVRWNIHKSRLRKNNHHSYLLQRAWNKYGEIGFVFNVLEVFEDEVDLIKKEQYYLDILKPEYNVNKCAAPGHDKRTEETKRKISENNCKYWKNKTFSKNHKKKLSIARRKGLH